MILMMTSCNLENDLFDEDSIIESCILNDENSYLVKAMIDNDCTEYLFVNSTIVRRICETLKINSVKLNKSRKMKEYDKRMRESITHVIYSRIIIKDYFENSILLLITKLD
jgi:murein endopeptidase